MEDKYSDNSQLDVASHLMAVLRWIVVVLGIWVVVVSIFEILYLHNYFHYEVNTQLPAWVQLDEDLAKRIAVEYMYMTDSPTGEIIIIGR